MRTLCIHLARRQRLNNMAQLEAIAAPLRVCCHTRFLHCPDKPRHSTCRRFLPRPHCSKSSQAEWAISHAPHVPSRNRPVAAINDDSVTCPQPISRFMGSHKQASLSISRTSSESALLGICMLHRLLRCPLLHETI